MLHIWKCILFVLHMVKHKCDNKAFLEMIVVLQMSYVQIDDF